MAFTKYTKDFTPVHSWVTTGGVQNHISFVTNQNNIGLFLGADEASTAMNLYAADAASAGITVVKRIITAGAAETWRGVCAHGRTIFATIRDATNTRARSYMWSGELIANVSLGTPVHYGLTTDKRVIYTYNATGNTVPSRLVSGSTITVITPFTAASASTRDLTFDGHYFWMIENGGANRILQCKLDTNGARQMNIVHVSGSILTNAYGIMTDGHFLYVWSD